MTEQRDRDMDLTGTDAGIGDDPGATTDVDLGLTGSMGAGAGTGSMAGQQGIGQDQGGGAMGQEGVGGESWEGRERDTGQGGWTTGDAGFSEGDELAGTGGAGGTGGMGSTGGMGTGGTGGMGGTGDTGGSTGLDEESDRI